MARLPPTGRTVVSLYERNPESEYLVDRGLLDPHECVTTLNDAIAGLGLALLTPDDEQRVRQDLQAVIGRAMQEEARPQAAGLQTTLRRVARGLDAMAAGRRVKPEAIKQIEQTLSGREAGLHEARDINAATAIWNALAGIAGDGDKADAMMSMSKYLNHASEIAEACRIADKPSGISWARAASCRSTGTPSSPMC